MPQQSPPYFNPLADNPRPHPRSVILDNNLMSLWDCKIVYVSRLFLGHYFVLCLNLWQNYGLIVSYELQKNVSGFQV